MIYNGPFVGAVVGAFFFGALAGCSLKFPDERSEALFPCETNADCTDDFACDALQKVCVLDATYCPEGILSFTTEPQSAEEYVGLPITVDAVLSERPQCVQQSTWWVCNAPAGSAYFTTDNGGCMEVGAADTMTLAFIPDVEGSFEIELRFTGSGGEGSAMTTVSSITDLIFMELVFLDPEVVREMSLSQAGTSSCVHERTSTDCTANADGCVWNPNWELCWYDCAGDTQSECGVTGTHSAFACTWNTAGAGNCASNASIFPACTARDEATCADVVGCEFDAVNNACFSACTVYADSNACSGAGCTWTNGLCGKNPMYGELRGYSIAQVTSDGAEVSPLRYTDAAPRFMYDPNGRFADEITTGAGQSILESGMAFLSDRRIAAVPHSYMYSRGAGTCGISQGLVLWKQGALPGEPDPEFFLEIFPPQLDIPVSATPVNREVAYPHMTVDNAGNYWITYGTKTDTTPPDQCFYYGGQNVDHFNFSAAPYIASQSGGPLASQAALEIYLTRFTPPVSGTSTVTSQVSVVAGYPCETNADCPDATICSAGVCGGTVFAQGYLPRIHGGGSVLTFSHVTCNAGWGSACNRESAGVDYDLILGVVQVSTDEMRLSEPTFIAAESTLSELDPMIRGDVFSASSELYYQSLTQHLYSVDIKDGALAPSTLKTPIPVFSLHKRDLEYLGTGWNVTPEATAAAAQVVGGAVTPVTLSPAQSCKIDAVQDRMLLSGYVVENPVHVTLSPNGRYLAYAMSKQELDCQSLLRIYTPEEDAFKLGEVYSSDIYIIDLEAATPTPTKVNITSCNSVLDAINLNPTFIADSRQLLFTTRVYNQNNPSVNRIVRINVDDIGDIACPISDITRLDTAKTGLTVANPALSPLGINLGDSRSYIRSSCGGCNQFTMGWFVGPVALLLWRRRRSRR